MQLYEAECSPSSVLQSKIKAIDLPFLIEDLPKVLASMEVGTERIQEIVRSLWVFSRLDEVGVQEVDLHAGIDSTLMILQYRLKASSTAAITITRDYGDLPLVECYSGQLNQVFMNLLANAIDALEETSANRFQEQPKYIGQITIRTRLVNSNQVQIAIIDNGSGIPESIQHSVFNPFFTTKAVGKGTGMGLSISYEIVTQKHGGTLECFSTPGGGTGF